MEDAREWEIRTTLFPPPQPANERWESTRECSLIGGGGGYGINGTHHSTSHLPLEGRGHQQVKERLPFSFLRTRGLQ
jgi:hypothetical protein